MNFLLKLLRGHYTSTACMHEKHDKCRSVCKFCSEPCRCVCHRVKPRQAKPLLQE